MIQEKKVEIKKEHWEGSTFFRLYWLTLINDDHNPYETELIWRFENAIRTPSKFKFRTINLKDLSLSENDTQIQIFINKGNLKRFWYNLSIRRRNYLYELN